MDPKQRKSVLITGGAGFLGANLAAHLRDCHYGMVVALDNFSRPGSRTNAEWLENMGVRIVEADIRDENCFNPEDYDFVFHFAGQVTVTESIADPKADFDNNLIGTINILEAIRKSSRQPKVIFSSTNKVYGHFADAKPIAETQSLDFLSPYGCSKGAADQYVLDYGRTFGLETVVLRQSCIYGERQFGMLGQGWISWFALRILKGQPITIYGNGKQVRDILYVKDWVNATMLAALKGSGVYNIGGGTENAISLLDAIDRLEKLAGKKAEKSFDHARVGDQEYYVSDNTKAQIELDWTPNIGIDEGLKLLVDWTRQII